MVTQIIKNQRFTRSLLNVRCYCDKSIYQRDEEGPPPRTVHGQPYPEWRKKWIERKGEWFSKLSLFTENNPSADALYYMQKIPEINMKSVKTWWAGMQEFKQTEHQRYLVQRTETLGPNLAAMHFFTFRGAAVRLKESKHWLAGDPVELKIPNKFQEGYFVEAIDCSGFRNGGIRFEGLENLRDLSFLKWLSLKGNSYVNVWGLDRLAGQNAETIEYLDVSGCNITIGCIYALARMSLKVLVLTDPGDNEELQAALSCLEQEQPNLLIKIVELEK